MKKLDKAYIAGGCFWCIEAPLQRVAGVERAISGYMGGKTANPTYQDICSGSTGHAEVVEIEYDSDVLSYQQLLLIFFSMHDATQLNRQGNDIGTQYRSAIFYKDTEQQHTAQQVIDALKQSGEYQRPIVTTLEPQQTFYPAEEAHQHYFDRNPWQPYCQIIIAPKLEKLQSLFADYLKK
ncbi:peptide-methionine (S)-S-oxide reductase MsrA [Thalassotalea maritima]|uniref:peptide-methionine (S)-S-oxide reductase MsrA n=1 Tax=Thalassotalea maritima TaxID=3242416 RepID=UPI0035288F63